MRWILTLIVVAVFASVGVAPQSAWANQLKDAKEDIQRKKKDAKGDAKREKKDAKGDAKREKKNGKKGEKLDRKI